MMQLRALGGLEWAMLFLGKENSAVRSPVVWHRTGLVSPSSPSAWSGLEAATEDPGGGAHHFPLHGATLCFLPCPPVSASTLCLHTACRAVLDCPVRLLFSPSSPCYLLVKECVYTWKACGDIRLAEGRGVFWRPLNAA